MITRIATGVFAFAAMLAVSAGSATAQEFPDGATVKIDKLNTAQKNAETVVLKKQEGQGALGDGIYTIFSPDQGAYLNAASPAGTIVGWSTAPTKWVLHRNSDGSWAIMHAEDEANAISLDDNVIGGVVLQRNQGYPNQKWKIDVVN